MLLVLASTRREPSSILEPWILVLWLHSLVVAKCRLPLQELHLERQNLHQFGESSTYFELLEK